MHSAWLRYLTDAQHIPILRYLARELGEYDGRTSPEKYIVDAVADIYIDWRVSRLCL